MLENTFVHSLQVALATTTNRLPPAFPLNAHPEIRTASSQADNELIAVEDGDPEKTSLTGSSHSAVEDSQTFHSEGEANQTYPSPTTATDSESAGEKVDLKSCLDVDYKNRDGVHGVLVHDERGNQK